MFPSELISESAYSKTKLTTNVLVRTISAIVMTVTHPPHYDTSIVQALESVFAGTRRDCKDENILVEKDGNDREHPRSS